MFESLNDNDLHRALHFHTSFDDPFSGWQEELWKNTDSYISPFWMRVNWALALPVYFSTQHHPTSHLPTRTCRPTRVTVRRLWMPLCTFTCPCIKPTLAPLAEVVVQRPSHQDITWTSSTTMWVCGGLPCGFPFRLIIISRWLCCSFCSCSSCFLITFVSPWYDLRGWLGIKKRLYIYLSCSCTGAELFTWSLMRFRPTVFSWIIMNIQSTPGLVLSA